MKHSFPNTKVVWFYPGVLALCLCVFLVSPLSARASLSSSIDNFGSSLVPFTDSLLADISGSLFLPHPDFFEEFSRLPIFSRFLSLIQAFQAPFSRFTDSLDSFSQALGLKSDTLQNLLEESYVKSIQILVPGYQPPSYALKLAPRIVPRLQNLETVIREERIIREQAPGGERLIERIQEVEKITEVTKITETTSLEDLSRIDTDISEVNQDLRDLNTSLASLNLKILNLGITPSSPIPPSPAPSLPSSAFAINNILVDQITPNIVSSVEGVVNDGGNIDFVSGSADLTITGSDAANTVTFSISLSGVNATLLDSLDSTDFLRATASSTLSSGTLSIGSGASLGIAGTLFWDLANDVTLSVTNPTGARTYTIPDFGSNDSFVGLASTQTLQNKTLATGTAISTTLDFANNLLTNIGNAGTDFVSGGGLTLAGLLTSNATSTVNANFAVLGTTATDSDFLYFDSTTTEWLSWSDATGTFEFSDDLILTGGGLTANATSTINANFAVLGVSTTDSDFIYFDATTTEYLFWGDASSTFSFSDDLLLEAGGLTANATSTINGNLAVLGISTTDSDFIYFDATTTEFLQWNNASDTFALSDDLDLSSDLITDIGAAGTDFTTGGGLTLASTFTANNIAAFNGLSTFNTDVDFVFGVAEDFTVTYAGTGPVDLVTFKSSPTLTTSVDRALYVIGASTVNLNEWNTVGDTVLEVRARGTSSDAAGSMGNFKAGITVTAETQHANSPVTLTDGIRVTVTGPGAETITNAFSAIDSNSITNALNANDNWVQYGTIREGTPLLAALYLLEESDTGVDLLLISNSTFRINLDDDIATYTERLCHSGVNNASGGADVVDCSGTPGDYAEEYGTRDSTLEAGDVVVADSNRPAEVFLLNGEEGSKAYVVKSTEPYEQGILGVVSTNPSEVIGQNFDPDENPRPVSLNGRVPVKVSTENGPISIGDPLTSSSVPGVAMKATKSGPVVAKALESYDATQDNTSGIGTILAFVSVGYYVFPEELEPSILGSSTSEDSLIPRVLAGIGGTIEEGVLKLTKLIVDTFIAKKVQVEDLEVLNKIQLRDQATGEVYCTWIENGEWVKESASCEIP